MSESAKGLEEKLKARGREKLKTELAAALGPINRFHKRQSSFPTSIRKTACTFYFTHELLSALERALTQRDTEEFEEAAIDEFMAKVDGLADEVQELRDQIDQ